MFYVYEWYVKTTGEIFYVGKGSGKRYLCTQRNSLFQAKIEKEDCDVRIVKEFDSEDEAYNYEMQRISELRNVGQCSCNIQDGGFGGMAGAWTPEKRVQCSEHNVMKNEEVKQRMFTNNPMFDSEIALKVNSKKRKPVIIDGVEYCSIKEASKKFGVATSTISSWCTVGHNSKGQLCHYKGQLPQQYTGKNNGQAKKVEYLGKVYDSAAAAAKAVGVAGSTMSRWCRQQRDSKGNICRYMEDTRTQQETIGQKSRPFFINDKLYFSKEEASRDLGIGVCTITSLLEDKIQNKKYICRYDNQQPSQGNTELSTLEGPETNE